MIGLLLTAGCTTETDTVLEPEAGIDGGCALPGDIDCSTDRPVVDGKADAWDLRNDPRRLSRNLNYRLNQLPEAGRIENEVWAASYWPTYQGSTNHRWQGQTILSPTEKYDEAFNDWKPSDEYTTTVPKDCGPDAKVEFEKYRATLGPASKWQSVAQGRGRMFDGVDSNDNDEIDECGGDDYDGIGTWWGYCPGWVAAAILNPSEPLHAVERNGVRFEVSDIKALLVGQYEGASAVGLGGRCNAKEIEHDDEGRVTASECRDTNPGAWHVIITNFVGINKTAFAEDRTGSSEVWNQPVAAYEITKLEEITATKANELLGVEGDGYTFNDRAASFREVRMETKYVTESDATAGPVGMDDYLRTDRYHYILEIDADGKIIGGEWLGSSRDNHPDFLWVPTAPNSSSRSVNPNITLAEVLDLLRESQKQPSEQDGGVWTGNASVISHTTGDATGYGLNFDIGRIHKDLAEKQTTFFQWEIDGDDGRRFKISADGVARAKITYGSWSNRDADRAYDVALPFVLDPTKDGFSANDGQYYTIAVELDAPSATTDIRGEATQDAATQAASTDAKPITVDGVTWNGNASIISFSGDCESDENCFGVKYDIANIHPTSDDLPVVFFQWEIDQRDGKTLEIKADGMDTATITYGTWSNRDNDINRTVSLPYIIDPAADGLNVSDGQYYTIKVQFAGKPAAKTSVWATAK
jgi:hypothetical protein